MSPEKTRPTFKCAICKLTFMGYGNNPAPIVNDPEARCCDDCDAGIVIPARIARLRSQGRV